MARMTWMGAASALAVCGLVSTAAAQDPSARGKTPVEAPKKEAPVKRAPTKVPKKAAPKQAPAEEAAPEAAAPQDDCPPGAFCEKTDVAPPDDADDGGSAPAEKTGASEATVGSDQEGTTVVLPPTQEGQDPSKPRTFTYVPDPDGGPGQLIIYEDGAKPRVKREDKPDWKREKIAPPPEPVERKRWRRHRKAGLNLRASGVLLPHDGEAEDVGMAGLGLDLRFRPVPGFALALSGDFLGGTDANGYHRQEIPLAATMMFYVNPRSLAQFYLMAGANYAFAYVQSKDGPQAHLADGDRDEYNYFGGHAGMGLEFRVSRLVGINIDGLAFVRTRVDDDGEGLYPEFYDQETGESTNTSVAGLLRAGVTFWW